MNTTKILAVVCVVLCVLGMLLGPFSILGTLFSLVGFVMAMALVIRWFINYRKGKKQDENEQKKW